VLCCPTGLLCLHRFWIHAAVNSLPCAISAVVPHAPSALALAQQCCSSHRFASKPLQDGSLYAISKGVEHGAAPHRPGVVRMEDCHR